MYGDLQGLVGSSLAAIPALSEAPQADEPAHERLCAFDVGGALTSRLDGLWAIASGLKGRVALTLDPTERHGFEYQSWLGFSIFADGVRGEIGRGGSYTIVHENGSEEAAIGFSLYADAIVAATSRPAELLGGGLQDRALGAEHLDDGRGAGVGEISELVREGSECEILHACDSGSRRARCGSPGWGGEAV